MKKLIALLLALCMVCGLLGCGAIEDVVEEVIKDTVFQKTGFSITLPAYAVDSSKAESAETEPYVLIAGDIIICAMEQYKEDFGFDMSAEEYAQVLVDSNNFDSAVETKDGLPTFTFLSEEDDLKYLCVTMVTDNSFWFINASCDPDEFDKNHETMWKYLSTVKVSATGEPFVEVPALVPVSVEDLTILVPAEGYTDITTESGASMNFVYMLTDQTVVMGLREEKASLSEEYQTLDGYAQGLIDINGLESTLESRDGIPCFTYTSDDGEFTYLAAAFEGTDAFWYVQGYSFTESFAQVEEELWLHISSVQVG